MADQVEARQANEQRKETERLHRDAQDTIKRDLRDLTVDVLRSKIDGLAKRTDTYAEDRPEDTPLPPDYETAREIAASTARTVEEKRQELAICDQAATSASDSLQEELRNESNLAGKIEMVSSAQNRAAENLESARSQRTDDAIATELAEAEQDARLALKSLQDAEKELSAVDPESLRLRLDNARDAFRRAGDDLRANEDRQNELRTTLAVRGDLGLHTRHADAESRLRRLKRDYQRTEARADAARLLYDTFSQRRREARQRYSGPFKQRIEQLGRIVFNPSFSVDIDQGLRITNRSLNGDTLGVDQLSTGTLEQLAVISRLACAAIVSPDGGGVPVIIDDALGWSDPDRLERMGAAIAAAGEHCQVIILTCTPRRYAHIGNATTIRLPA